MCQSHPNDSEKVHDAKNCDVADDDFSSERIDETLNEYAAKRYDELLESRRQSDMKNVFDLFCIENSAAVFCKMKFVFQKLESQKRTDELGQNGTHGGSGHAELESDNKKQIKNKIYNSRRQHQIKAFFRIFCSGQNCTASVIDVNQKNRFCRKSKRSASGCPGR